MTAPKSRKYQRPDFLVDVVEQDVYERWLRRKAQSLVDRDRRSGAGVSPIAMRSIKPF